MATFQELCSRIGFCVDTWEAGTPRATAIREFLAELMAKDQTMESWMRHLSPLYRKPKRHAIDELCMLTDALVLQDQRVGSLRAKVRQKIEDLKLEVTVMGKQVTEVDLVALLADLDAISLDRIIHQNQATRDASKAA